MLLDLADPRTTDPRVAGAKGAGLAQALQTGLPVLPGFVIPVVAAAAAMRTGSEVLATDGSGRARSTLFARPLPVDLSRSIAAAVERLGEPLVVRSSSPAEGDGRWSGAFASYLSIGRHELDIAVRGCWASVFSVEALARARASGPKRPPTSMAVLIQPSVVPVSGGVARVDGDDVVVIGVRGSPAPLVQGWDPGAMARVADDGTVRGDAANDILGATVLRRVAGVLRRASVTLGATSCEWAELDGGRVVLLQVDHRPARPSARLEVPAVLRGAAAARLARSVRRAPGPLGEALVLPWSVGEADDRTAIAGSAMHLSPGQALADAQRLAEQLTRSVWGTSGPDAVGQAGVVLRAARGSSPEAAIGRLDGLPAPDPDLAAVVHALVRRVRKGLVACGEIADEDTAWYVDTDRAAAILDGAAPAGRSRIGVDRWEPFISAVTLACGRLVEGTPAASGVASGRSCFVSDPAHASSFRPRDVLIATHPVPGLGALLWDAAGIVTIGGGPGAHLFESARSLGIPAISGAHVETVLRDVMESASGHAIVAMDGDAGVVAIDDW